jgi:hypothetical protein
MERGWGVMVAALVNEFERGAKRGGNDPIFSSSFH